MDEHGHGCITCVSGQASNQRAVSQNIVSGLSWDFSGILAEFSLTRFHESSCAQVTTEIYSVKLVWSRPGYQPGLLNLFVLKPMHIGGDACKITSQFISTGPRPLVEFGTRSVRSIEMS